MIRYLAKYSYSCSVTDDFWTCPVRIPIINVIKAVQYVIYRALNKRYWRRTVLVMPIIAFSSIALNAIAEEAIRNNITVITPAGKTQMVNIACIIVQLFIHVYKYMCMDACA